MFRAAFLLYLIVGGSLSLFAQNDPFVSEVSSAASSDTVLVPEDVLGDDYAMNSNAEESFDYAILTEAALQGLDSSLDLFRDHPATSAWIAEVERLIRESLDQLEERPEASLASLQKLAALIVREDARMEAQLAKVTDNTPAGQCPVPADHKIISSVTSAGTTPQAGSEEVRGPRTIEQYEPQQRVELLKGLRYQLDRRIYLWTFAAHYRKAELQGELIPQRALERYQIDQLLAKTEAVRNFFGVTSVGIQWRERFEVDRLYEALSRLKQLRLQNDPFQPAFTPVSMTSTDAAQRTVDRLSLIEEEESTLHWCINSIQSKVQSTSMTEEQRHVFQNATLAPWLEMMAPWVCDQGDMRDLLLAFEEYEKTSGADAGRRMSVCAAQLRSSPTNAARKLGEAIPAIYDNPNVKVYVSEYLINRFIPERDPEYEVVQETILNNPVAGSRRADTQVRIKLVPDDARLLMHLYVSGKIVASTRSEVFPAQLFNQSEAVYLGRKLIEWTGEKVACSECEVAVNNSNRLNDVRTDIDFVPLVGEFARELVRGQYQSMQGQINQEMRRKIVNQVKTRVDSETNSRFGALNDRLAKNVFQPLSNNGLHLTMKNSRTTSDWLLASMKFGEVYTPGSQTREPETLPGAFADLKIHESALNVALGRLNLAGKEFTVPELRAHLADTLHREGLRAADQEDPGCIFGMAFEDPISVSFHENRIQIRLRFDYIALGDQEWDDVEAVVSYQPMIDEKGNAILVRDGLVSIDGPMSIRAQIPLRLIFAKAFPAHGQVPLRPKVFEKDERFAGLSVGLCRVSEGWFAISVIQLPCSRQAAIPVPVF
ncbi:MAG: hypothetical protein IIZ25_10555 [Thermoguttaceae bacterium]|nr:hypothetical protein [Thermoguttaceae bacterium]